MMREDNNVDGSGQIRPVLGNLTNRPFKRGFSLILGDSGLESNNCGKNIEGKSGSKFPKHARLEVADFVKENSEHTRGSEKVCQTSALSTKSNKEQESDCSLASSDTDLSYVPKETVEYDFLNDAAHLVQDYTQRMAQGDASGNPCSSNSIVPTCYGFNEKDCSEIMQSNAENEGKPDIVLKNHEKDIGMGKLASGNHGSPEWSRLPRSEGSKSLGLERCSGLKSNNCVNLDMCDDLLKSCSCSFCLKASYIWSDLHYQDIKGRISALKKSQKDASILTQKSRKEKEAYHDQGNSSKSKLEYDLSSQWMSLFHHMENMFAEECNRLQTSFVNLKDLREECKMNLEKLNGMPTDKH